MTCRTLYSSSITLSGTTLTVTVSGVSFNTLPNLTDFNLVLCQSLPAGSSTAQVVLNDGTTTVNAFNLSGNYLRADQIRCRKCYSMRYGNDPQHVSMRKLLCNTSFETAPAAAAAAVATASAVKTVKA